MKSFRASIAVISLMCAFGANAAARWPESGAPQASAQLTSAPTIVRIDGALKTPTGEVRAGSVLMVVSLYADKEDTTALWVEQQLVTLDQAGRYTMLAGATLNDGVPKEFLSGSAPGRWLGIGVQGEAEQIRMMLVTVPYALRAREADTLAGKTATDFMLVDQLKDSVKSALTAEIAGGTKVSAAATTASALSTTINQIAKFTDTSNGTGDSIISEAGVNIGIGTTGPSERLEVNGNTKIGIEKGLILPTQGAPFSLHTAKGFFNGVRDDVVSLAYNLRPGTVATPVTIGEPIWKWSLEANWYNGANHFVEANLDYQSADGRTLRRPVYITVNRDTNASLVEFFANTFGVLNDTGTRFNLLVGEAGSTVFTNKFGSIDVGVTAGLRTHGTITTVGEQAGVIIGNTFDPVNGQSASGALMRYNAWGAGSKDLVNIKGFSSEGNTWTKGTSGSVTNAYAGYFTAPTIATNNYALYTKGETVLAATTGKVGIGTTGPDRRLDVLDVANPQLRLTYTDGSVYTDLRTTSGGYLSVSPSGALVGVSVTPAGNGVLQLKAGSQTTQIAKVGGVLFDHYADAGNLIGTGETDLYADSIPGSTLAANGDKLAAVYSGTLVSSATATRQIKVYFGDTVVFDTGGVTLGVSGYWTVNVEVVRDSNSSVRCVVRANVTGPSVGSYANYATVSNLILTDAQTLKVTGTAAGVGSLDNDIVARVGYIEWKSAQ